MVSLAADIADDLRLTLDRVAFAESLQFRPDPWQRDLLRSTSRRVLLNCSRQSGKTTVSGIVALHRAIYHPGSLILCLAPAQRQAQLLFGAASHFYRALKRPVPAEAERRLSLDLENGSRIVVLPGTEKTIRGFSGVDLLLIDEAARVPDALYYAVRPMLAVSGGALVMLSTPFGKRGVFYEEWNEGEEWTRFRVPATGCPRISPDFLAEERRRGEWWYLQEYGTMFMEAEDSVFGHELVAAAISDDVEALDMGGGPTVTARDLLDASSGAGFARIMEGNTTLPGVNPGEEDAYRAG